MEHLLAAIRKWKADGEEIVLYMDVNEHVYTGRFGRALLDPDINMKEQFFTVTGHHAPASHFRGERPITGLFATAGLLLPTSSSQHTSPVLAITATLFMIWMQPRYLVFRYGTSNARPHVVSE